MNLGGAFLGPLEQQQRMDESAAMAPAELAHKLATTRYLQAQSGTMEQNAANERRMGELMAQRFGSGQTQLMGPPEEKDANPLLDMAEIFAKAGLPKQAMDAFKDSSLIKQREATTAAARVRALEAAGKMAIEKANVVSSLLFNVNDETSWRKANEVYQIKTGEESPFAKYPYNPELVELLREGSMSVKERVDAERRAEDVASRIAKRNSDRAHQRILEGIRERELASKEETNRLRRKTGGKDSGTPTNREVDAVQALFDRDTTLNLDAADRTTAAFDIAAQARSKRIANPGMSADEAMRQAFTEAQSRGDFKAGTAPTKVMGVTVPGTGKPGTYKAGSSKAPTASVMALPKSGNRAELVVGQMYRNPKGDVMKWTKSGWQAAGGLVTGDPDPEDDDEDDDE